MQAAKITVTIPEDHRLVVTLPLDLPPGPAEIIVLAPKTTVRPDRRAALGMDRGTVRIAEDFDAPLPDELQRAFEGEP